MKTPAFRKLIFAASLGICAMAGAAPSDASVPSQHAKRPVAPHWNASEIRMPGFSGVRPLPAPAVSPLTRCVPSTADEKLKLLPRPFPMPDFGVKDSFTVTGTDGGCILKPGKPIRPIPSPRRSAA